MELLRRAPLSARGRAVGVQRRRGVSAERDVPVVVVVVPNPVRAPAARAAARRGSAGASALASESSGALRGAPR